MSFGKKWKMTIKQLGKQPRKKTYSYKVGGGRRGRFSFKHFRHKKWFKFLDGHVSMRFAATREIWFWD